MNYKDVMVRILFLFYLPIAIHKACVVISDVSVWNINDVFVIVWIANLLDESLLVFERNVTEIGFLITDIEIGNLHVMVYVGAFVFCVFDHWFM